jgi:hypothetical protein
MRYLSILLLTLIHLNAAAQQGVGPTMVVDPGRVNEKLHEFTVLLSGEGARDLIPRGAVLRGAYRMHSLGRMANSAAGPHAGAPAMYETPLPAENFKATRSIEKISEACTLAFSKERLSAHDLVSLASMLTLAEQIEQEELEEFYGGLIRKLDTQGQKEINELVSSGSWSVSYSRLDWAALVDDSPDVAEFLIRHSCANVNRLVR